MIPEYRHIAPTSILNAQHQALHTHHSPLNIKTTRLCVHHTAACFGANTRTIYTSDKLMHFLPQLLDFVALKNGFDSFRAQID